MSNSSPRLRWFQFGLFELLVAVSCAAISVSLLLLAQGTFWWFASMTISAGAFFGAAAGALLRSHIRFTAVGAGLGLLFALYAAAA